MHKFLASAALSLGLAVTSMPVFTAPSLSQDLELNLGREGPRLRLRDDCDPSVDDCVPRNDRRYRDRDRDEDRRDEERAMRGCTEGRALDKAERMGIRRARVSDSDRRTIEITGRDRSGDRVFVTFGRRGNCPVLS